MPVAPDDDAILQVRVLVAGISPRAWRRVLGPSEFTLRELHSVIQVVMGTQIGNKLRPVVERVRTNATKYAEIVWERS